MRVDEAGERGPAAPVEDRLSGNGRFAEPPDVVVVGSDEGDRPPFDPERGALDPEELALAGPGARGASDRRGERREVPDGEDVEARGKGQADPSSRRFDRRTWTDPSRSSSSLSKLSTCWNRSSIAWSFRWKFFLSILSSRIFLSTSEARSIA